MKMKIKLTLAKGVTEVPEKQELDKIDEKDELDEGGEAEP
jgi:hypothetical protein